MTCAGGLADDAEVEALLALVVADEVRSGLALLSDEEIEADAARPWRDASDVSDAEDLVRQSGVALAFERELPPGIDGLALPHVLIVRPSRNRQLVVLRILHELAHWLLGISRAHTHADVWRLTLALAWPVPRIRRALPSLDIPVWALELRALIIAESRLITAA